MVRMVKAEEESLNTMAEEAATHAFQAGILLMSSSDDKDSARSNLHNIISTFSIFKDQYANSLDQPEWMADLLGWIMKPLWHFAAIFHLPSFFYTKNVFSINELTSLFHLPDGTYNRSPIISWMQYKVLP